MPLSKKNFGPCTIENWQYETSNFHNFIKLAAKKVQKSRTLTILEYSHLISNQHQLYNHHYLFIVKPNRNNPNYFKINETFQNLQKTEKSFKLKWNNIHLEILDDKI
ncbi:3989_t:CDS:1, partial [Cetraspora pellucida]